MAILKDGGAYSALFTDLRKHYKDFYAGKLKRPCDDDCPDGCDGKHNYELPEIYPELFSPQRGTKEQKCSNLDSV